MKKSLIAILALSFAVKAYAQPEKPIQYYTDSDVKNSIFSVSVRYSAYGVNRRISDVDANPNLSVRVNQVFPSKTGFGMTSGVIVDAKLTGSLRLGVGAEYANFNYGWENAPIWDRFNINPGDTLFIPVKIQQTSIQFPIRVGFVVDMNDAWALEVWPSVRYNKVLKYVETGTIYGGEVEEDLTDKAAKNTWMVGLAVGGSFYINDWMRAFLHLDAQYTLDPFYQADNHPREMVYAIGGATGLRFHL